MKYIVAEFIIMIMAFVFTIIFVYLQIGGESLGDIISIISTNTVPSYSSFEDKPMGAFYIFFILFNFIFVGLLSCK